MQIFCKHIALQHASEYSSLSNPIRNETPQSAHLRYRVIWDCRQSIQALCDAFRLVPVESYPSLAFVSILHVALAIINAFRLLSVEDQGWGLNTTRGIFDLPGTLQQLSGLFDEASSRGSPRSKAILHGRPIFSEYAKAYWAIERWYATKSNINTDHSNPDLNEPGNSAGDYFGFDFWNPLSELTNGVSHKLEHSGDCVTKFLNRLFLYRRCIIYRGQYGSTESRLAATRNFDSVIS